MLLRSKQDANTPSFGDWHTFGLADAPAGARDEEDRAFIFIAKRKEESWNWEVPEKDDDLLSGVGTLGTRNPKGDDTFETLLMMQTTLDDA